MKKRISVRLGLAVVGLAMTGLCAINVAAEDSQKPTAALNNAEAATSAKAAPVQLSTGTWDVLKLVQSKVGDDTTIAFINNSSENYGLGAMQIIYLREQGVSERVITAMLTQHSKTPVAHEPAPAAPPPANTVWAAPAPAQSSTTEAAAAPVYSQPTTVYVTPPAQSYVNYYPSYPYYYPYYSPVSLSFGIGFGYYGGCYGGYHGGYYCGGGGYHGGYHGGGGHGGHH